MIGAKEPAARREFEDKLLHGIVTYMSKKYHDLSWAFELCEKVLARFRRYVPTVNEMHKHPEADANALATGKMQDPNAVQFRQRPLGGSCRFSDDEDQEDSKSEEGVEEDQAFLSKTMSCLVIALYGVLSQQMDRRGQIKANGPELDSSTVIVDLADVQKMEHDND